MLTQNASRVTTLPLKALRGTRQLSVIAIAWLLTGCGPTFNVDDLDAFQKSLAAIDQQLDSADRLKLRNAICYLAANGEWAFPSPGSLLERETPRELWEWPHQGENDVRARVWVRLLAQKLGGMTARAVIAAAERQSTANFHRSPPIVQVQIAEFRQEMLRDVDPKIETANRELAAAEAKLKPQQALLANVMKVESPHYGWTYTTPNRHLLDFVVVNIDTRTINAVSFYVEFLGRNSTKIGGVFHTYQLGRLEPGERQSVSLTEEYQAFMPNPSDVVSTVVSITNAQDRNDSSWIVSEGLGLDVSGKQGTLESLTAYRSRGLRNLDILEAFFR